MFQPFLCLLVLTPFVKMTEMIEEYDDPASAAYRNLRKDFVNFEIAIIEANFESPTGSRALFLLKQKEKSCDKRCNETRKHNTCYCHCDELCPLYKDCCVDYWLRCNVTTKPFNQSTQELWDCVDAKFRQPKNNRTLLPLAYMMINRCPITKARSSQGSRSCIRPGSNPTDISERIPVTGEDNKTYRNAFCAACHGIKKFTHWGLKVACLDPALKNRTGLAYLWENCAWYLSPGNRSDLSVSPCTQSTLCESVIRTVESSQYDDLVNKCKAYSQLVDADAVLYKNFHCASCNGKDAKKFQRPSALQIRSTQSLSLFFDYSSLSRGSDANNADSSEKIESYLTVTSLSLSITCLLAVVMTYIRFKILRTVPGLVLLALSLSLLAYQGLLLASPYVTSRTPGCKTMAILLHFMILNSFAWMTVMSYDVSKTFSQKGNSSRENSHHCGFHGYVIFTSSVPGVIVALASTLGATNAMDIGYGESSPCWIGTQLALILFFYIPVGIMLLFNAVSLIWTIFSIRNVAKMTQDVQKSVTTNTRRQNIKVYIKLSTVMGLTWFLGFGAAHNTIVAYFYIIINSLQGVFIFISFVLNKRTLNMWRNSQSTASTRNFNQSKTEQRETGSTSLNQESTKSGEQTRKGAYSIQGASTSVCKEHPS